jgi:hypothetical protein
MKTKTKPKVKTQHSSYWMDEDIFNDDLDTRDDGDTSSNNIAKLIRLSAVRRAIGNFVSILSGKNIPVVFKTGDDSYTDGESVVIAADDNTKNFDVMVGLALHEGSHVLLTDFKFLRSVVGPIVTQSPWMTSIAIGSRAAPYGTIAQHFLHPEVSEYVDARNDGSHAIFGNVYSDIKTIMNVLEDRRIDAVVYRTAKGYRPYYNALYEKYFFHKEIAANLKHNPDWREPTVNNYINQLIMAIHPDFDPDAMLGLRDIVGMMDLPNIDRVAPQNDPCDEDGVPLWNTTIDFNSTPILWQEANRIYLEILKYVDLQVSAPSPNGPSSEEAGAEGQLGADGESDGQGTSEAQGEGAEDNSESSEDTSGAMTQPTPATEGKFNPKTGTRALQTLADLVNGELKKKKVSRRDKAVLDNMEKSEASLETVNVDGFAPAQAMVVRKLTEDMLDQSWVPFGKAWYGCYDKYIEAGRRMGAIMANRLQLRNDPLYTKNTRLNQGKIDRRLLANLGMDIDSVFYKDRVDQHRPAMLHLSIDGSGSMQGKAWGQSLTVATALAYVATKIRNVDVVISLRAGNQIPVTVIAFDSRKDTLTSFIKIIRQIQVTSATPEGLCFDSIQDIILDCKNTHDVYFINFSDGVPAFSTKTSNGYLYYAGATAYKHTRKMINKFRDNGVKILSYYIEGEPDYSGSVKAAFRDMYGEDAHFIDVSNVTQVLNTLNRRLAVR